MPTSDIDKFLKSVEGLTSLAPDDIAQRLVEMRGEADMLALKIAVLERAYIEATRRTRPDEMPSRIQTVEPGAEANGTRAHTWKSDAVLAVMQTREAGFVWNTDEIRQLLRDRGLMKNDEGTPTRLVMRRLAQRGEVLKTPSGGYSLPTVAQLRILRGEDSS